MKQYNPPAWPEERSARLEELWRAGCSAGDIAADLGQGVTRNAVIGKAHRMNLPGRPSPIKQAPKREYKEYNPKGCQYPLWEPDEPITHEYCGARPKLGSSYCPKHHRLCRRKFKPADGEKTKKMRAATRQGKSANPPMVDTI